MSTAPVRIAIVGAGPGGLICARVLQRHGIAAAVYDLDTCPGARDQGGSLDMHPDTGAHALRAAGVWDAFRLLARPEGEQMRLVDRGGRVVFDAAAPETGHANPEIDRGQLRGLLLDSLTPGTVRWDHRLEHVERLEGNAHRLHFADRVTTVDADLVVGADGAWSKVRRPLSDAVPLYTGVTFVETGLDDVDVRHGELAALTGNGTMMALDDNQGFIAQRNSGGHIRVYVGMRTPEDWHRQAGLDLADPAAVRDALLSRFAGWGRDLLRFVTDTDTGYTNRPLYALPVPHTWDPTPGLTLLGDAAHLMSPISGMGANLAMRDGADLAQAIVDHGTVDEAVIAYEKILLPRSIEAAHAAAEGIDGAFAPDSAEHTLAHMTSRR
ncbi:NAD(P)/FAD-dependent oxidoreductase [Streptomyces sp. SID3343]|uniref:FAD-dependent oxidoreductase n=1 Tax=Streptomyces sp. SID3343 TaxID=2690260 RepID=UPI0013694A64|nr:NAD(P)/FAD-dependent oxidoreductase [Streptomyces sp. SID3343]MYW00257.1 NAD(P)-binding protein [Streptomyces sp. SID3343]